MTQQPSEQDGAKLPGKKIHGTLIPIGGGDNIPLLRTRLRVGRRDGCDIVLPFSNISGHHCLLEIHEGYWFVRDLNSRNGVKVNGQKIIPGLKKRLDPGDELAIAKNVYRCDYDPLENGAYGTPPQDEQAEAFFERSLLERAGLKRSKEQ
ncbi:MAG: FHA domain-containing protein [Planctomycetaceae bacterium]|nr:FHA domain-containing protein [Planctomycetaceae bacterium]